MKIKDIMTRDPAMCTPDTPLDDAAHMMVMNKCGAIPVVDNAESKHLVGIITDRDIVCRIVAKRKNPLESTVAEAMSSPVAALKSTDEVEKSYALMESNQVRRLPVIDGRDVCVGIVTQGKLARYLTQWKTGELERIVSRKTPEPSRVGDILSSLGKRERTAVYAGR